MTNKNYSEFIKRIDKAQKDFKNQVIKDLKHLIIKAIEKESLQSIEFEFSSNETLWFSSVFKFNGWFKFRFDSDFIFDFEDFFKDKKKPYTVKIFRTFNDLFINQKIPQNIIKNGFYLADSAGFWHKEYEGEEEWQEGWDQ